MKFTLQDIEVVFPYAQIYPEQYQYMRDLKHALDTPGHALLEMPSGTGKTIALLALCISYLQVYPQRYRRLIYCSRTVPEIEKTLVELKRLMQYRDSEGHPWPEFLALGLTSRKNNCLNEVVSQERSGRLVDAKCRNLTATWIREKAQRNQEIGMEVESCSFYENLEQIQIEQEVLLPAGVYTLADLKEYGREKHLCPYYLSRRTIKHANVIIYSYHYLLDPKIAEIISSELGGDCIVVFDEAHNIGKD